MKDLLKTPMNQLTDKQREEAISLCCGQKVIEDSDICSKCKEHTEIE